MGTNNLNKRTIRTAQRRIAALACAAGAALALSTDARAVTYTYTPAGTSDSWSLGTNWSATPVGAPSTRLTFVGDNTTVLAASLLSTSNNDIAGAFQLNILDLQGTGPSAAGAASITISGNPLELVADGAANPAVNLNALNGVANLSYTITNGLVLTNNTTFSGNGTSLFNFIGAIDGGGSLTKSGTSTLLLSGANNYTGNTTITGGTLRATAPAALSGYDVAGKVVVQSGGTVAVAYGGVGQWISGGVDALRAAATFQPGSALGFHVDSPSAPSYDSNITEAIGLTKTGGQTLYLRGTNTYTGPTTVAGGTLRTLAAASLPGYNVAGRVNVATGATLRFDAGGAGEWTGAELDDLVAGATFASGSTMHVELNDGDSVTISAPITQPLALNKSGAGTLALTGTNTHTGQTTLSNGRLVINDGSQLGSDLLFWGSNVAPGATLEITSAAPVTIANDVTIDSSNSANSPATLVAETDVTFTGTIRNSDDNGRFDTNNTGLTILSGPVHLSDSNRSRTLRFSGSGDIRIDGVVSKGTAGSLTGNLTYQGTGTMTLTNSNTHNGRTNVAGGTVVFTNVNAFGTSTIWLGAGGSVPSTGILLPATGGPVTLSNNFIVDGSDNALPAPTSGVIAGTTPLTITGSLSSDDGQGRLEVNNTALTTFAGPVNLSDNNSNRTLRILGTGDVLISGNIDDGGTSISNLTYQGSGTLTLTGTNAHDGRTTVLGNVVINNNAQLGNSTVWMGSSTASGTLLINDSGAVIDRPIVIDSSNTAGTAGIVEAAGPLTFAGPISNSDSNGVFNVNNTGLTTISGPINLSDGASSRTLRIGGSGNVLVSGAVSNGTGGALLGNLTYQGTGTLTLTGPNTYAGTTAVTSGAVVVEHSAVPANNAVVVSGGTYQMNASADVFDLASLEVEGGGTATLTADGSSTLSTKLLTIGSTSMLNMNDNDAIVDYTGASPEFTLRDKVLQFRDGPGTAGIGFTETAEEDTILAFGEAAELGITDFNGITVDDTTVVGKYTYYGDANFDGQVTTDDYVAVDLGLGTGNSWVQGDFDLNGVVTTDDYVVVDLNLGKGTANPLAYAEEQAAMIALHTELFGQSYLDKLAYASEFGWVAASVPEPAGLSILALAVGLLPRHRRRRVTSGPR